MTATLPPYTDQQRAAIETRDVSLAISAGAGCGKTFVLTQRFLSYLQPGQSDDPLAGIVAITFTERAAREMRDRIRSACYEQLKTAEEEQAPHWLQIIRGLDSARISTIHSFCATLLRANAVTAGIDPRFALLEETVGASFRRRVVKQGLYELLEQQDADCMELVLHFGLERTIEIVRDLLLSRFEINAETFAEIDAQQLAEKWQAAWETEYLPAYLEIVVEDDATQALLRLLRLHQPDHADMQERRLFLLENMERLTDASNPQELLLELIEQAKVQGGGGKKVWVNEEIYELVKNALTDLRKKLKPALALFDVPEESFILPTRLTLAARNVVEHVADRYHTEKKAQGILDFDDLLIQTRNLLRDSTAVRNRVAAGINFLMVDEFQDTDPVQADIVRLLCNGEISDGKLFLVGDVKQSVYRFRRADPKVFLSFRNEIPEQGRLPLSTNFRSQPEILNFVNCIFTQPMGKNYEPLIPGDKLQLSPTPAVEFLFATPDSNPELGKLTAEEKRRCEAIWICKRVQQLLHDETPRIRYKNTETGAFELRTVEPGDIVILFRGLTQIGIYENELRKNGLHYYLVGGHAFFAQQETFDFVNLCQYLDDPNDTVSLMGVLRSPWFGLTDDTLLTLTRHHKLLQQALTNNAPAELPELQRLQVERAASVLRELAEQKDHWPIAQLLQLAIERTGYDAALLLEFLGRRKLANLRKLLDMARAFDQSGQFTLKDFAVSMQESITEETKEALAATHPETSDVIRLMSIHQSKGLEFPVVIIADMDPQGSNNNFKPEYHAHYGPLVSLPEKHGTKPDNPAVTMYQFAEKQGDAAESLRLLYVALTRAADYLILSAGLPPTKKVQSPWMKLLSYQFDIETGEPVVNIATEKKNIGEMAAHQIPDIYVHTECPEVDLRKTKKMSGLSISKFREAVDQADVIPLPATLQDISPDLESREFFSVSEIETADAELRPNIPSAAFQTEEELDVAPISADEATRLGTFIHRLIERIDFQNPLPVAEAVEQEMRQAASHDKTIRETATKRLQLFYDSDTFKQLAAARECYREIDFRLRWESEALPQPAIISGQIDCLFQNVDETWQIIDFKTGRVAAANAEQALQHYEIQLALYVLAFEKLYQQLPDATELIIIGNSVEQRAFQFSTAKRNELQTRIAAAITSLRTQELTAT